MVPCFVQLEMQSSINYNIIENCNNSLPLNATLILIFQLTQVINFKRLHYSKMSQKAPSNLQAINAKRSQIPQKQQHAGVSDMTPNQQRAGKIAHAQQETNNQTFNPGSSGNRVMSQMSSQMKQGQNSAVSSGVMLMNPSQAVAKESSNQLQHKLKDLKDNYQQIELAITKETQK